MIACAQCKETIHLSDAQDLMLRRNQATFFCLWGHNNYFPQGQSEAEKLRLERDRLKQQIAQKNDEIAEAWTAAAANAEAIGRAERRVSAAKGQITRLKNRASAGVCPCCNRTFVQLARHMAAKHKGFMAEEINLEGATVQ